MTVKVMSFDPGIRNFGYARIAMDYETWGIEEIGMVRPTIDGYGDMETDRDGLSMGRKPNNLAAFRSRIDELITGEGVTSVTIERFQNRGKLKQEMTELNNLMMGIMLDRCLSHGIGFKCMLASQWKNSVRHQVKLDLMEEKITDGIKRDKYILNNESARKTKLRKAIPHMLDSVVMGLWAGAADLDMDRTSFLNEMQILEGVFEYLVHVGWSPIGLFDEVEA